MSALETVKPEGLEETKKNVLGITASVMIERMREDPGLSKWLDGGAMSTFVQDVKSRAPWNYNSEAIPRLILSGIVGRHVEHNNDYVHAYRDNGGDIGRDCALGLIGQTHLALRKVTSRRHMLLPQIYKYEIEDLEMLGREAMNVVIDSGAYQGRNAPEFTAIDSVLGLSGDEAEQAKQAMTKIVLDVAREFGPFK